MLREAQSVFMAGASTTDPFGARSGVRPGTSATTVTATSTTWTMGLHAGILDMETAVEAGPYAYAVNTAQTGAVTAADATRPRVDIVWVRLDDPAESDGSSVPAVVAGYTAGVPLAGTPVAPATPARCMVLATIQVPMSGGGSPTVIWVAPYTVAAGAPTPVYSQADRDAKFPVPYDGLAVYRLDLHRIETYNGTAWVPASGSGSLYTASGSAVANVGATGNIDIFFGVTFTAAVWAVTCGGPAGGTAVTESAFTDHSQVILRNNAGAVVASGSGPYRVSWSATGVLA